MTVPATPGTAGLTIPRIVRLTVGGVTRTVRLSGTVPAEPEPEPSTMTDFADGDFVAADFA